MLSMVVAPACPSARWTVTTSRPAAIRPDVVQARGQPRFAALPSPAPCDRVRVQHVAADRECPLVRLTAVEELLKVLSEVAGQVDGARGPVTGSARDAGDWVADERDLEIVARLLERAEDAGDEVLARAVAARASP